MATVKRSGLLVTVLATLVIGLAGCSSETPGNATPGGSGDGTNAPFPTEGSETNEPSDPETSSPDGGDPSADSLAPCDLLTDDEQSSLSLGPGEESSAVGARSCTWQASGRHTVGLDIWDNLGIDELESKTEPQATTVGSHAAMQGTGDLGACVIAIEITESSRVDVIGVAGGDMTKACGVANQAAELVETKLP